MWFGCTVQNLTSDRFELKTLPQNQAGQYEGDYTVNIYGQTITVTDSRDNIGTSHCHPDDAFDIKTGFEIAMDRCIKNRNEIRVGDTVKIVNNGGSYTTFTNWVVKNVDDKCLIAKYAYNKLPENGAQCIVEIVDKTISFGKETNVAYIRDVVTDECYLINIKSLEKVVN